jgi:hypothetical protein
METDYPWNGKVDVHLSLDGDVSPSLRFRLPGWSMNNPIPDSLYYFHMHADERPVIRVNGEEVDYKIIKGYAVLNKQWQEGDLVQLEMPMPVRKVLAHDSVAADRGRFALQRGPLVYCLEDKDQQQPGVRHVTASLDGPFESIASDKLGGITTIRFQGNDVVATRTGERETKNMDRMLTAIPYAFWANRGPGQMLVWIPYDPEYATPRPAPTIAYRSTKSSSGAKGDLRCLADQYDPIHSNDHSIGYIHWWPARDTTMWLQYEFDRAETIGSMQVFWFDDGPDGGCRVPHEWKLLYRSGKRWIPVKNLTPYTITKDAYDNLEFQPVTTPAVKLEIRLQKEFSGGVHEWAVGP